MDRWAIRKCVGQACHDSETSPESRFLGCAVQTCPDKVKAASPMTYITPADPPIMILHGDSDQSVPHNQGEPFYMALNKACKEAIFISGRLVGPAPGSAPPLAEATPGQTLPATARTGPMASQGTLDCSPHEMMGKSDWPL
jgi:hypothetical protein